MSEPTIHAGQMTLADALPHARNTDPATSKQAAARITNKRTIMLDLLRVFARFENGCTAETACGLSDHLNGGWKRVSDLKALGYLSDTGYTMTSARTGRKQALLVITPSGKDELAR